LHDNSKNNHPILTKLHTHILQVMVVCPIDFGIKRIFFEFMGIFLRTQFLCNRLSCRQREFKQSSL